MVTCNILEKYVGKETSSTERIKHDQLVGVFFPYPSEKYEFVNFDDEIPNTWKKNVPNHQPVKIKVDVASKG